MSTPLPTTTPQTLDAMIAEWRQLKTWMTTAKERETFLRGQIAEKMFAKDPAGAYPEGTSSATVAGTLATYKAKMQSQWNREIDIALLTPTLVEAQLTAEETRDLIRGKPELSITAYRKLPDDKRAIIDKMITVKQGSITLEVVPIPK